MKLNTKDKLDLLILSLVGLLALYFFFQISEGWVFWLDAAVIVACGYLGRRVLKKKS